MFSGRFPVWAILMDETFAGRDLTSPQLSQLVHRHLLSRNHHLLYTIQAADVDHLSSSDGITTTGADIFSGGACFGDRRWRSGKVRAGSSDSETDVLIAIDKDVSQIIVQAELKKTITGLVIVHPYLS